MEKKSEEHAEAQLALRSDVAEIRRLLMAHGTCPGGDAPITAASVVGACNNCCCHCDGSGVLGGRALGSASPVSLCLQQVISCLQTQQT